LTLRVLAVDPGDVRLGLAISDPTGIIARPLRSFTHHSRAFDAQKIVQEAEKQGAEMILVGLALGGDGEIGPQARKGLRLVDALRKITDLEVVTWDESDSTRHAKALDPTAKDLDSRAAAIFLQDFLDSNEL
jgi:putative Holliday junction resolvase